MGAHSHETPQFIDLDLVTKSGEEVASFFKSREWFGHVFTDRPRDEFAFLKLRFPPHPKRAILRLGPMPGLPEENRGITNLFDVRVPYLSIERSDLGTFVEKMIQFGSSPNNYYQYDLEERGIYLNRTVRELWIEAQKYDRKVTAANGQDYEPHVVRPDEFLIDRRPPRLKWLRDWLPDSWFR